MKLGTCFYSCTETYLLVCERFNHFRYLVFLVYGKSLNTTVTVANSSSFYLNWEFAEDIPHYGSFQGYQVLYRKGNTTEDFLLSTEINDNITEAWFTGGECELHTFKVRAFSLEGYGKLSEPVTMETSCKGS